MALSLRAISHGAFRKTAHMVSSFPGLTDQFSIRSLGTLSSRTICKTCGESLPTYNRLIRLFEKRRLRDLRKGILRKDIQCPYFKTVNFTKFTDCELANDLDDIAKRCLKRFSDVIYANSQRSFVLFGSLQSIPREDLGDLTGDHGKQLTKFINVCIKAKGSQIGAIIDIGGQNTSTTDLITELFVNRNIPCLIVDINPVTPAISPYKPNVRYVIDDAYNFFSKKYHVAEIVSSQPALFIFNNLLNIFKADKAWDTLKAAWEKLRYGDYLIISGLDTKEFDRTKYIAQREIYGIVEFYHDRRFYKSALRDSFSEHIKSKLKDCRIEATKPFSFYIDRTILFGSLAKPHKVLGRRLLTLKKVKQ